MKLRPIGAPITQAAAVLLLGTVACGSDDGDALEASGRGTDDPAGTTTESSPFTVAHEPEGFRLVQAGLGTISQTWSSDSFGDDEPITLLAPPGADPDGPDVVRVSLTGFEGFQGGLDQASAGYLDEDSEHFEIDGQPAIYSPGHDEDGEPVPADLVVVAGDDLAVRVSADATRDEMVEIARAVEPEPDHLLAPLVPDPPGDLEVVGSADADVAITLVSPPWPGSDSLPAGDRAHSAVWAVGEPGTAWSPDAGTVAVNTLPGQALDLDATAASLHRHTFWGELDVVAQEVDGRPGVVLEQSGDETGYGARRAVATATQEGDLLLVVAQGEALPSVDELVAVAASVEPSTPEQWDDLVLRAQGGPGLHPDEGAVELSRGTADGIEWLLQSRVDDGNLGSWGSSSDDPDTTGQYLVDPCLKLATGERVCTSSSSGTVGSSVMVLMSEPTELEDGQTFPGFVVVMTTLPAATMRVHTTTGDGDDVPLVVLPGDQRRAAVLVTPDDLGFLPDCATTAEPETVQLLDEAGQPLPCR
ncbi:MAG: hypothetical protein ACRD2C_00400 [Acidimicrobiales bacterium]